MPPPFRMVVLGDSIMWGQGLLEAHKFSTKVQHWLSNSLSRVVTVEVFAHSRAVIEPNPVEDSMPSKPGEVPHKYPSVSAQSRQVPNPHKVDLVLMDGGINDMGAEKILSPFHLSNLEWIGNEATVYCGKMQNLLSLTILPPFSKAIVVVTGYYPLVSEQSDPLRVTKLVTNLCPELAAVFSQTLGTLMAPLAAQSLAWRDASDKVLREAVAIANKHLAQLRVIFVPVKFGPEHCYAAPATLLWALEEEDSVAHVRRAQCLRFAPLDPTCPVEATFHPNQKGAEVYSEAIKKELQPFISTWKQSS